MRELIIIRPRIRPIRVIIIITHTLTVISMRVIRSLMQFELLFHHAPPLILSVLGTYCLLLCLTAGCHAFLPGTLKRISERLRIDGSGRLVGEGGQHALVWLLLVAHVVHLGHRWWR